MNISISGSGVISTGEYEKVHIAGSCRMSGTICCQEFHCSGSSKGDADITCSGDLKVSGALKVQGNISAGDTKVSGAIDCGSFRSERLSASGGIKCDEFKSGNVQISGGIKATGDLEAENLQVSGAIACGGLINAETIDIRFSDSSSAGAIGGSSISIKPNIQKHLFGFMSKSQMFNVDGSIEGDEIYLENVTAREVKGRNVTIGPNCTIDSVQYSEEIKIDQSSNVKNQEKA